ARRHAMTNSIGNATQVLLAAATQNDGSPTLNLSAAVDRLSSNLALDEKFFGVDEATQTVMRALAEGANYDELA
ncbi:MAG: hypothetical protein AAF658_15750, partial [Myxococcota bacterium]